MALAAPESVTFYKQERKYLIFGVVRVMCRRKPAMFALLGRTYQERTTCKNRFHYIGFCHDCLRRTSYASVMLKQA